MPVFDPAVFDSVVFDTGPSVALPEPVVADDSVIALDHTTEALARLPRQYRVRCEGTGETNTQKLIRVLMSPAAELEAALLAVLTTFNIDKARGFLLDLIGARVGRPREGVTDDEIYRRYVRAQISANKSDGVVEDILTVARLVVDDEDATFTIRNEGAAAYTIEVGGIALDTDVAAVLMKLLLKATSGGVRVILEYSTAAPANVLRWSTQGVWGTGVWARATDREI